MCVAAKDFQLISCANFNIFSSSTSLNYLEEKERLRKQDRFYSGLGFGMISKKGLGTLLHVFKSGTASSHKLRAILTEQEIIVAKVNVLIAQVVFY